MPTCPRLEINAILFPPCDAAMFVPRGIGAFTDIGGPIGWMIGTVNGIVALLHVEHNFRKRPCHQVEPALGGPIGFDVTAPPNGVAGRRRRQPPSPAPRASPAGVYRGCFWGLGSGGAGAKIAVEMPRDLQDSWCGCLNCITSGDCTGCNHHTPTHFCGRHVADAYAQRIALIVAISFTVDRCVIL
jgi:hypothetical protein